MMEELFSTEPKIIKRYINDGDIVFDVGYNRGLWSMAVNENKRECIIHKFDPAIDEPGVEKIVVGRTCGKITFYKYGTFDQASTIYRSLAAEAEQFKEIPIAYEMPMITIDEYCKQKNIEAINFMKIDVEGAEYDVLRGSENKLKNGEIHYIQFEYGMRYIEAGVNICEVYDFLSHYGFMVSRIEDWGLDVMTGKNKKRFDNVWWGNFFAAYGSFL